MIGSIKIASINSKYFCIIVVIFSILFFADLNKIDIPYKESLNSMLVLSKIISQVMIAVMTTLIGILFAVYILLIQSFRHRYPVNFIEYLFKDNISYISYNYLINIIIGLLLTAIDRDMIFVKTGYIFHCLYCIFLFSRLFKNYKIVDVTETLKNFKNSIIEKIEKKDLQIDELDEQLSLLEKYSEESFSKNELQIAKFITNAYAEIIKYFLENRVKLINNGYDLKEVEKIERKLFFYLLNQAKLTINYNNKNYLDECFDLVEKILKNCIKCDNVKTFNNFSKLLDKFCYKFTLQDETIGLYTLTIYGEIAYYIVENNFEEDNWFTIIKEKFELYGFTTEIYFEEKLIKSLFGRYFALLDICLEKTKEQKYYNEILNNILDLVRSTISQYNNAISKYLEVLFVVHSNSLIKHNDFSRIKEYITQINITAKMALNIGNADLSSCIYYVFVKIEEECSDIDIKSLARDYMFDMAEKAIGVNLDIAHLFIPDYSKIIKNSPSPSETVSLVIEKYLILSRKALLSNNTDLIIYILNEVNNSINLFNRNQKQEQQQFVNFYSKLLDLAININSDDCFYAVLQSYSSLIKNLDKENKISQDLMKTILNELRSNCSIAIREKQVGFCLSLNGMLTLLIDELNLLAKQRDLSIEAIELLYQIGLDGIENNIEDIIRNVSNHLGWTCQKAISYKDNDKIKFILEKAVALYNMTIEFGIDDKTAVFIGTLFIILGGYSHAVHSSSSISIISHMKMLHRPDLLQKSKKIREHECITWDAYMKGDAKGNIELFWKKYKSS